MIGKPAEIPFVKYNGIYDFRADGDNAIYLQDDRHNWYHATFMGPCTDLPFATRIAVKTRDTSSLDRFGEIIVGDDECQIEELVTSDPPPEKVKKAKHKG